MHDTLIIIGASGHGKVVADIALKTGKWKSIYFLDDNPKLTEVLNIEVIGRIKDAEKYKEYSDFFVGIGDNYTRKKIFNKLINNSFSIGTLIHPTAIIGLDVDIGPGTAVMAGAVINSSTKIGNACIVNTSSIIEHDNEISDYVHISSGAKTGGNVTIKKMSWIGIGSTIINNINISDDCIIGAGATVTENIDESGVYVGLPARRIADV